MTIKRTSFLILLLLGVSIPIFAQYPLPTTIYNQTPSKAGSRWWWMGSALDENDLRVLMEQYAQTGIGTLEITPIYGVNGNEDKETSFLSKEWFEILKKVYKIAEDNNITIEMNMGSGWPFGGSFVPINDAACRLEYNYEFIEGNDNNIYSINILAPQKSISASLQKVLAYPQGGNTNKMVELTDLVNDGQLNWKAPEGNWLVITVFNGHTGQKVKRAGPGAEGYVLNHYDVNSVENYLEYFQQKFEDNGANYPYTFFCDSYEVYNADWTPLMFEEFYKYRGYHLEENMDLLLGLGDRKDIDNIILFDYRKTLHDMLYNNFAVRWTEWCRNHGIKTRYQAHGSPANILDLYALSDIPEIEGYGITPLSIKGLRKDPEHTINNNSDFATLKMASSAAHVSGRQLTSCESFTWLTEHFRTSLSQIKPELDLLFCSGVNHVYFHGTTYSPISAKWPGWKFYASIDMSPTNSIWQDAKYLMEYIERCQNYLQTGSPDNDYIVYAPFEDAWKKSEEFYSNRLLLFSIHDMNRLMPDFISYINDLDEKGYSCDYASSDMLLTCTYSNGKIKTKGGLEFKSILVPFYSNMPEEVRKHLIELQNKGASILWGDNAYNHIETSYSEELRTKFGLRYIRRKISNGYLYFIANLTDTDIQGFSEFTVDVSTAVFIDPLTGYQYKPLIDSGRLFLDLKSGQSLLIKTNTESLMDVDSVYTRYQLADPIIIKEPYQLSFSENCYPQIEHSYTLQTLTSWENLNELTSQLMGTGIYETSVYISKEKAQQAELGWLVDLGDVRESARLFINNEFVGCLWSVPFSLKTEKLHEGWNDLRIEVTNLPANRIRKMEQDGVIWRIFKDANINSVNGKSIFSLWEVMPSGLNENIIIYPVTKSEVATTVRTTQGKSRQTHIKKTYRLDGILIPEGEKYKGIIIKGDRIIRQ